jgi:hypothetical protein
MTKNGTSIDKVSKLDVLDNHMKEKDCPHTPSELLKLFCFNNKIHIGFHGSKWTLKIVTSKTNGLRMEVLLP